MNPYSTHSQVLKKELEEISNSKGVSRILEFGCGDGSSSIFSSFADSQNQAGKRVIISSFESDKEWLDKTKKKYELENYNFNFVDWTSLDFESTFSSQLYDLVFIDQSPWEARIKTLEYFSEKGTAKTIILHDYDYYNKGVCGDILSIRDDSFFKKWRNDYLLFSYSSELPPTLVMKDRKFFSSFRRSP
jgi:hypothetical protein